MSDGMEQEKKKRQELAKQFDERLKKVENYTQLKSLKQEASEHDLALFMKKRKVMAFDFTDEGNKVSYLIDDSVSTGLCQYKNLHKVMEFQSW